MIFRKKEHLSATKKSTVEGHSRDLRIAENLDAWGIRFGAVFGGGVPGENNGQLLSLLCRLTP